MYAYDDTRIRKEADLYEVSNMSFNAPKQETIREAIRCKHCNAPMNTEYSKCEYCGTVHMTERSIPLYTLGKKEPVGYYQGKGEFQPRVLNSEPRIIKPLPDDTSSDKHRH